MKRLALVLSLACVMVLAVGCVMPTTTSIQAPIMMTRSALAVGDTDVGQSKVGEAEAVGIVLIARGDASIKAACDSVGITRIHHVDTEEYNILNIYCRKIIRVYGE